MLSEIPVIFQDSETVVVEKPIGISIHNTEDAFNLIDAVESQLGLRKLFPVHRLDKETSGVQIFALNELAARKYAELFQSQSVKKLYVGIVRGALAGSAGIWSQPLSDKSEGRMNPSGVVKDRVSCETRYKVTQTSKYFTKCEFDLITGRQHQIRKHAAVAGHALVGDPRYGDPKYNGRIASMYDESRMYLHCGSVDLLGHKFAAIEPDCFGRLFTPAT